MEHMSKTNNAEQRNRYSGGLLADLQRRSKETQEEYERGGHSEKMRQRLIDQLREISGGVKVAGDLIPRIIAEHKRGVEWGLERLLVSVRRLEDLPHVEPAERQAIEQRIAGIISLIDLGKLDV